MPDYEDYLFAGSVGRAPDGKSSRVRSDERTDRENPRSIQQLCRHPHGRMICAGPVAYSPPEVLHAY